MFVRTIQRKSSHPISLADCRVLSQRQGTAATASCDISAPHLEVLEQLKLLAHSEMEKSEVQAMAIVACDY